MKKTNRCVVAHEAVTRMGFGAEVAAVVQYQAFDWLDAPIERVGAKFTPLPFAPVMEEWCVPHADDVLAAVDADGRDEMATEIKLPRLGQGMESGTIVKWLKSEGEPVEKGEPLYELDTDKVTQEVEADASGVLLKIAVEEGEVEVGKTIAVIGEQGEEVSISGERREGAAEPRAGRERRPDTAAPAASRGQSRDLSTTERGGRIKASPLARRIARERGIDLAQLRGTGPDGRIVAEDVERAADGRSGRVRSPATPGQVEVRQLTSVRKTIARRLTQAWEAPVFQLVVSADMTQALALVERLRELHPDERPTVTDVLTRVTAAALDAPPRRQRALRRRRDPRSTRARTSASPSPRRRGSSFP